MEYKIPGIKQGHFTVVSSCFYRKLSLIPVLFSVLVFTDSMAQDEAALKHVIEARDLKKLEKADRIKLDADRHKEEAKKLNLEIRSIQLDSGLLKRSLKRKTALLATQSWQNQEQASALYSKSNSLKYGIYKKYLNRFWKDHEGEESNYLTAKVFEEQARDNYAQASIYRRNTRHMNLGIAKVEKLSEANNLEFSAIRRQVSSLTACFGISETPVSGADHDSIATPVISEKPGPSPDTAVPEMEPAAVVSEVTTVEQQQTEEQEQTAAVGEVMPAEPPQPAIIEPVPLPEESRIPEELPVESAVEGNQVIFRVQVAASRAALKFEELSKSYSGIYPVELVSEGGWFKYQFMGVPLYSDALRIFRQANVKGSFIVSYRKDQKLDLVESVKNNMELEKRVQAEGRKGLVQETEYHVELVAYKTFLKAAEVARLYNGPQPVVLIMEQGLYEYHLKAGYSLAAAEKLKQQSGISGAVIVAYKNAKRINSYH